eukprot:scaffold117452_cov40-Tisochrysis_lutea.AAC.1
MHPSESPPAQAPGSHSNSNSLQVTKAPRDIKRHDVHSKSLRSSVAIFPKDGTMSRKHVVAPQSYNGA